MKREAVGSTKMKRLCNYLGVRQYVAIGILECLWHMTAREAPRGDIGKLSNEDIALGMDWDGDPEVLVASLVKSRWLDHSEEHRLIVHDWHEHSDDAVDSRLGRSGTLYASGQKARMKKISKAERDQIEARYAETARDGAQRRTAEHKKALPEPVPEPVPVPEPEPVPEPGVEPPTPPPVSAGADGEFLFATGMFQELGLAAFPSDIRIVAQVIAYEARSAQTDSENAAQFLLQAAQQAIRRGEVVNAFWFKDRKFATGESHAKRNRSQARTDGNVEALRSAVEVIAREATDRAG